MKEYLQEELGSLPSTEGEMGSGFAQSRPAGKESNDRETKKPKPSSDESQSKDKPLSSQSCERGKPKP